MKIITITYKLLLICSVFILFNLSSKAQDSSQTAPEFLIGAFIASMHPPYGPVTLHTNYDSILACGFNSVWQKARRRLVGINDSTNLEQLARFSYVFAANDSGTGSDPNVYDWCDAKIPGYIDWISYFTQAKYTRWEAEGNNELFNGNVKVKHEFGDDYTEGNISGWASGTNQSDTGKFLIKGPDYWQWPRYTYTNPGWNPSPINYKAVFRMKIDSLSEEPLPVCQIMVTNTDKDGIETVLEFQGVPAIKTLTTEDLTSEYNNIVLIYDYIGNFDLPQGDPSYPSSPTSVPFPFDETEYSPGYNSGSKVQFKVKWLGNRELFVDHIEVCDQRIWARYFADEILYDTLISKIYTYDQNFKNANSSFYEKLKYYGTIDEPHVIDSYEPLRKIQFILDSLSINADLLVHWYPGWDYNRDGDNTWPLYNQLAQPKKLMFWYSPFVNEPENNYNPKPRDFTLYWLQKNLQQAHQQQPDFYVTLQTWGTKNLPTGNYEGYMYPTTEEINAETMLALSHGVTGIFYEVYYSFFGDEDHTILYEALVDVPENNFQTTEQWNKVKELASRLHGRLGKTLMTLNYTGEHIMLRRYVHQSEETGNFQDEWLTLSSISEEPTPPPLNFHAGILENPYQTDNKYFLLSNLITSDNRWVNIEVTDDGSNFNNTRFRNIESEYSFDTTFTDEFSVDMEFPAGEGYLFQVAPVLKYGGNIIENDTVTSSINLIDNMIIRDGAIVTINDGKQYTAMDTIKLEGTGFISGEGYFDRGSSGWVILDSWDYSVFKGREGDHPKIIWSKHPTIANILDFKVYMDKGTSGWVPIKTLSNNVFEYIDSAVTIIEGDTTQNEVAAEYFVIARYFQGMILKSDSSNTITYWRVEGGSWEKSGAGKTKMLYTYSLEQNYPNPFNPTTTIEYSIERDGNVEIEILDILGRRVTTLVNEHQQRGHYTINFNASSLSSGIYFYRIRSGKYFETKKMILLK